MAARNSKTRKVRAKELVERLTAGPASFMEQALRGNGWDPKASYDIWVSTWIIPEIEDLIPELQQARKEFERRLP